MIDQQIKKAKTLRTEIGFKHRKIAKGCLKNTAFNDNWQAALMKTLMD